MSQHTPTPLAPVLWIYALLALLALATAPVKAADRQSYSVTGLSKDAEIVVDDYGVPHIYAQTHYDAFFVQGFNAARDRLWQIDTWRRRGLGRLAEVFGAAYVEQDRAARLFLYRGDMYAEWLAYGNDAKKITEAFVAGINAYVDLTARNPELLPPEFELLGYRPAKWSADEVVRIRSHGLWRNVVSEVTRARLYCAGDAAVDTQRKVLEPAWQVGVPAGLDTCALPEAVLDDYLLATAPVDFSRDAAKAAAIDVEAARERLLAASLARATDTSLGSNNWAIAPDRSTTGRAILADDPHRGHAVPSLRYIVHMKAPGLDVIGAGEPALPGISIGHNERIAFGLTIFPIDQEDLYIYELLSGPEDLTADAGATNENRTPADAGDGLTDDAPQTPTAESPTTTSALVGYRYNDHFEPLRTLTESIPVKDGEPVTVTLEFTRHGPVVYRDEARDARGRAQAYAVRAAWLEPGMAPYFGSIEYMRASNWREFVGALNRWGAPSENQVYADIDGNIGYKPAGRFPKRDNFDGLLPVPGDGRYEWDGYFDMDVLPEEYNPDRGWVGTANALSLPGDYDINRYRVGFEWSAPWRMRRLTEVLSQAGKLSPGNSLALQRDYVSILAREVVAGLPPALPRDSTEPHAPALRLLQYWKGRMTPGSKEAAFYAVWFYRHLQPQLATHVTDGKLEKLDTLALLQQMRRAPDVVTASLASAWAEAVELMGDNADEWQWGTLHRIEFTHPLLDRVPTAVRDAWALPSLPRGGTANTTNNTGFRPENFLVRSGASFRMVVDVGNWDKAQMTNAPGQSGDPRSPFYGNLLQGWANDKSFPLYYSRYRVERNARLRIDLRAAQR
ncbi:MAG: penicillin acylase family protein [Pseudomonadota bacterium]